METIYTTTLNLRDTDILLNHVTEVVEKIREVAHPHLIVDGNLMPKAIRIDFAVGDPEGIEDLWDLRAEVEALEADLRSYMYFPRIDKPTLV